jgi:phosphoenolpyruvate carboxykinase (GTP)
LLARPGLVRTYDLLCKTLISPERFAAAQAIDVESTKREILTQEELFLKLAGELPKELIFQRELLVARL